MAPASFTDHRARSDSSSRDDEGKKLIANAPALKGDMESEGEKIWEVAPVFQWQLSTSKKVKYSLAKIRR